MVNRQQGSLDPPSSPPEKKRPKRLGLYKEGKSMMEKIVKETFKPDPDEGEVKKVDKVVDEKKRKELEKLRRGAVVPSTDSRKLDHYKKTNDEK
jgi:hypothetical protein